MPDRRRGRILMLVNTHVYDDPRVLNEAGALAARFQVCVIGAARRGGVPARRSIHGFDVILTPMVTTRHPVRLLRAMWRLLRAKIGETTAAPASAQATGISLAFYALWVLRLGWSWPADVVHSHDLSPLPPARLLASRHRARLVYDSHENVPDYYPGRKGRWMARIERVLIRRVDAVITVGERLARDLGARGAERVVVVGNWKNPAPAAAGGDALLSARHDCGIADDRLVVAYIGSLDESNYALRPLLEAVGECADVTLLIGGRGDLEPAVTAAAARHANIRWLGWVDHERVPLFNQIATAIYCCLNPGLRQARYVVPNKLFEAFAAGKPVIARRGVGEIGAILDAHPAAVLLDEVTPETLKGAFHALRDPGALGSMQCASRAAAREYNWSVAERRLRELYEELAPSGGARPGN